MRYVRDTAHHPYHAHSTVESNDGTERDIRMAKLKQKVPGGMRTLAGARRFCAIRSYLSTAAKHSLGFLDILVMLTNGEPGSPQKLDQTTTISAPDQLSNIQGEFIPCGTIRASRGDRSHGWGGKC